MQPLAKEEAQVLRVLAAQSMTASAGDWSERSTKLKSQMQALVKASWRGEGEVCLPPEPRSREA